MLARPPSKILCVGRNYAAHAAELGNEVPKEPLVFLKPSTAVIGDGEPIVVPGWAGRVEHEGEIGIVIGRRAKGVAERDAWSHVARRVAPRAASPGRKGLRGGRAPESTDRTARAAGS